MKKILYSYFLVFSLFMFGFNGLPYASFQITNRAGLVVQFEDDRIETYCISFNEESISGYEFLKRSELQLEYEFFSMGVAICKIEDVGCPPSECLICEKPNYWAYWHMVDDEWSYSTKGASDYHVSDGDVDGWAWGTGEKPSKLYSFDEICVPTPTPTSTPTLTYTPNPTNTPIPTNTPKPTKTPVPTNIPPIPPTASYSPASNPTSTPTPTIEQYPTNTLSHSTQASPTISTSSTVEPLTSTPSATTEPAITNLPNTDSKEKPRGQSNSEEGGLPSKATGIAMPTRQTTPTLYPDSTSGTTSPILNTVKSVIYFLQNLISTVYSP